MCSTIKKTDCTHWDYLRKKVPAFLLLFIFSLCFISRSFSQLHQIHVEPTENNISKASFYSLSDGYVGFTNFVGFTTDTGRTFTPKYINTGNVNFNGYGVNLTFGFEISGVKAFNKNTLIVYGDYGLEPSILYSTDQGNTFKLVFHAAYDPLVPGSFISDMVFPANGSTGYAVYTDNILRTTDGGLTWLVNKTLPFNVFTNLQAINNNQVYAIGAYAGNTLLFATIDAGNSWQQIQILQGNLKCTYFLTANMGWLNIDDGSVYATANGGSSWIKQNNTQVAPFIGDKIIFTNDSTGYALAGNYEVYKTTNSGKIWERLHRDNNYSYLNFTFSDLQLFGNSIWAGGGHGFIELSTNGGGTPIPNALFAIDTTTVSSNSKVNLVNYSRSGYNYTWYRNGKLISNTYNASYTANVYGPNDTIRLIVSNQLYADTVTQYTSFSRGAVITGFTPVSGAIGTQVLISGSHFSNVTGVSFGGIPAASFKVNSSYGIVAVVGKGASGNVTVTTTTSNGSLPGFTFIPPPKIASFAPLVATAGSTITLNGVNFANITGVSFGGQPAASFALASPTQITAVLGYGTTGDIIVYSQSGNDTVHNFKVLPQITSISPTSGNYGTTVDISGTGFGGLISVTIDGDTVKSFSGNSLTDISIVVGDATAGNITVTTTGGSTTYSGFIYYAPPIITSFIPASAAAGATMTINGANFSPVPSENIVYFGAVKAIVTAASAASLTVTVPIGATYQPISVISHQNVGYSSMPFILTFIGGGPITSNSFGAISNFNSGNNPRSLIVADLDNDNKPELVIPTYTSAGDMAIILNNKSKPGNMNFSFGEFVFSRNVEDGAVDAGVTDADMDGKLDLVLPGVYNQMPGYVTATHIDLTTSPTYIGHLQALTYLGNYQAFFGTGHGVPADIGISDMDGDGKADYVIGQPYGTFPNVKLADLDGDGKADVLVINGNNLSVYKNISTKGNIAYASKIDYDAGGPINRISTGDFDGDGKLDVAVTVPGQPGGSIAIFKNTSTTGNISFTKVQTIAVDRVPGSICAGDLDGDGKIDLVVAADNQTYVAGSNKVYLYKNTATIGSVSFAPPVVIDADGSAGLVIADLDADGKSDIAGLDWSNDNVWMLRNLMGPPQTTASITAFNPAGGADGTTINITGTNFTGATAVTIGGYNVKSFTVNSATSITAVAGADTSGYISVVTPANVSNSLTPFTFLSLPVIVANGPLAFNFGGSVQLDAIPFNNNYTFQWAKDGVNISGATNSFYIATTTGSYTVSNTFGPTTLTSAPTMVTSVFTLPASNFKLSETGVTCKGSNNGAINITANTALNYTATVTVNGISQTYAFTTTASITSLAGGIYNICITVSGHTDYQQCFTLELTEPKDLSVYATVNKAINSVILQLDGANVYNIQLNDETVTTSSGNITLQLKSGTNKLMVSTDKLCQGIVEKLINVSDTITPYPNPFQDVLNVNLGGTLVNKATVKIMAVNGGRVLLSRDYAGQYGVIQLKVSDLEIGVYILSLTLDNKESIYKITK